MKVVTTINKINKAAESYKNLEELEKFFCSVVPGYGSYGGRFIVNEKLSITDNTGNFIDYLYKFNLLENVTIN